MDYNTNNLCNKSIYFPSFFRMNSLKICLLFFSILTSQWASGQFTLSGKITNENNEPIPYSNIYVKLNTDQRTVANETGDYTMQLFEGEYYLVISSEGYEDREAYITITNKNIVRDVQLFSLKVKDIDDVSIKAKKTNIGRDIMLDRKSVV